MKRFWFVFELTFLVATLARTSRAHDPFEITAVARIDANELVLETTMARSTALRLAAGDRRARATFAPEAFAEYEPRLRALGSSLYELADDGRPLPLRVTSVALTGEGDVAIALASPAPRSARLRFRASHLAALPEGYTSAISVAVLASKPESFKLLTAADPAVAIELPARPERSHFLAEYWPALVFSTVLVLGGLAERLARRSSLANRAAQSA